MAPEQSVQMAFQRARGTGPTVTFTSFIVEPLTSAQNVLAILRPSIAEATVWTLEQTGYTVARKGRNAFTCVVSRRAGDLFPVCWDAEVTRSLLPLNVEDARLRLAGKSGAEIDAIVAAGFRSGDYHAPARAGIAYMLSPMRYRIDEQGIVTRTVSNPHLMFYGPNLTDGDIGGARGAFVSMNRVGPDGMMIVPVGQQERDAIIGELRALVTQVEQAIGFQSSRESAIRCSRSSHGIDAPRRGSRLPLPLSFCSPPWPRHSRRRRFRKPSRATTRVVPRFARSA